MRKKLIEVALPLEAVNQASSREKSIRHGHPSTLHLWWARRPLAAARAVLFAQMVDDPSACPEEFPTEELQEKERGRLFKIIEDLVIWENTNNREVWARAQTEIRKSWRRTCADNANADPELFNPEQLPAFHDPFAGGGTLPLEAQRLGLESYASDLNPVAVLINKAMIEIPPQFAGQAPINPQAQQDKALFNREWSGARGLAEDVRYYGQWLRDEAEKRIGWLYPKIEITPELAQDRPDLKPGQKLTVIAWLWARTVKSPNPAFAQVEVPLVSSFVLSSKKGKEAYVEPVLEHGSYRFVVKTGPAPESAKLGTKLARGANFRCLMSDIPIPGDYIKAEGQAGRMGSRLMAVVAEGSQGRVYLSPTPEHEAIALQAKPEWKPETYMPDNPRWFSPPAYGQKTYGDLFTPRQLTALSTFSSLVGEAMAQVQRDYLTLGARPCGPQYEDLGARPSWPQCNERAGRPRSQDPAGRRYPQDPAGRSQTQEGDDLPEDSQWHSRGYLPHWEAGERPQSISFRLHGSLPQELLERWRAEFAHLPDSEAQLELRKRIDTELDSSRGECWLRDPRIAELVENALLYFDGQRYRLHAWCIMPNHVHVLMTPLGPNSLSAILHSWKSYSAKIANQILGRSGAFWMEEYFDRAIRDQEHYAASVEYIENNPVKAGLCARAEDWQWSSAGHPLKERLLGPNLETPNLGARPSWPQYEEQDLGASTLGARPSWPQCNERAGRPRSQGNGYSPESAAAYAQAVGVYLAFVVDKCSDYWSSICSWHSSREIVRNTFGRQAIPMVWDYAEANPFSGSSGSWESMLNGTWQALATTPAQYRGRATQADAQTQTLSQNKIISTDPPYYDNIGYADLSDFFYVWLSRSLGPEFPELFNPPATPKAQELVATPYRHGSKAKAEQFFLDGMTEALHNLARQAHPAFPVTIFYAFKQSETKAETGTASTGWETFLAALISAGFAISGTWPMRSELGNRMNGMDANALASSIVLVCRPRSPEVPSATRREFINSLKAELPPALAHLQASNIAPVDLAQAAIGPGMAIYTRYAQVLSADGNPVSVREALALINQTLDEVLAEQEGDFDPASRWAVTWFEQHGFAAGEFGSAETLSKAKNTSVAGLVEAGIVKSQGGQVSLLKPEQLAPDWQPSPDSRLTSWEIVHHLIRTLQEGETQAARILASLGGRAEGARELAYRLYTICERKKRAEEALAYNGLVQSWPELARLARAGDSSAGQVSMFAQGEE